MKLSPLYWSGRAVAKAICTEEQMALMASYGLRGMHLHGLAATLEFLAQGASYWQQMSLIIVGAPMPESFKLGVFDGFRRPTI